MRIGCALNNESSDVVSTGAGKSTLSTNTAASTKLFNTFLFVLNSLAVKVTPLSVAAFAPDPNVKFRKKSSVPAKLLAFVRLVIVIVEGVIEDSPIF